MLQQPELMKPEIKDLFFSGALNKDRSTEEDWRI
jgi:hypothetical protein